LFLSVFMWNLCKCNCWLINEVTQVFVTENLKWLRVSAVQGSHHHHHNHHHHAVHVGFINENYIDVIYITYITFFLHF